MPHFTKNILRDGPLADVVIGSGYLRTSQAESLETSVPTSIRLQALIDTGASETCIDIGVIRALNLRPSGMARVSTSSTGKRALVAATYEISLLLLHPDGVDSSLTLPRLSVSAIDLEAQRFKVLLGRDILKYCVMTYNGSQGWITLAY